MATTGWLRTAAHVTQVTLRGVTLAVVDVVDGRGSWVGSGRMWVHVYGLDGAGGDQRAKLVLAAVRALPGVRWAELNRPLSRVVLATGEDGPTVRQVSAVLREIERGPSGQDDDIPVRGSVGGSPGLPGDGRITGARTVAVAADAVGLAAALTGRLVRLPRLPGAVAAAVTLVDYQPRLRRVVERRLGQEAADLLLAVSTAAAQTFTQGPASLAVDLALRISLLAEAKAAAQAWVAQEPELALHARSAHPYPTHVRPRPLPVGPDEKYADGAALAGLVGAGVLGAVTGRWNRAADAVVVAAPKAIRTARGSFSAGLGRLLATDCGALVLREDALRRLDRVDALLIDPRALLTDELTVAQVAGVQGSARVQVWTAAGQDVDEGLLGPGWHPVEAISPVHDLPDLPGAQVSVTAMPHPLAAAVLAAARNAQISVASLDVEELGELRSGFDELAAGAGTSDAALLRAVTELQAAGRTVALLAVRAPRALAAADVGLAVHRDGIAPAWTADVLLPDLSAAWRIITAVPAAKAVSRRSVQLATGGSLLGALLMVPGVRGRGPGPVAGAAAAGLWTGWNAARRIAVLDAPAPALPAAWHNVSGEQAQLMLPNPDAIAGRDAISDPAVTPAWWLRPTRVVHRVVSVPVGAAASLVGAVRTELSDPLTPILATGAAASAVLGSPVDAVLVGSVMFGNAALSAVQRLRAERLLQRLLAGQQAPARVVLPPCAGTGTDGAGLAADEAVYRQIPAPELRVGQVVEVRAGEIVPADARVLTVDGVEVDESSLTGESLPVEKQVAATPGAPLAERSCLLFEGTVVLTGAVTAVVTAVGTATEAGRAAALPGRAHQVGLQAQLARLTSAVLPVTAASGAAVSVMALLRGAGVRRAVISGVSIAVAAVPEGLPLVATLAQQAAARRLSARGILVRSPRAVEALGRVDVVCFDKTGTLTQNVLQVREVRPVHGRRGEEVLEVGAAASPTPRTGGAAASTTDAAVLAAFHGELPPRQAELPFRAGRPFSACLSGQWMQVKGAPELIAAASTDPHALAGDVEQLAGHGLRVLAVARRRLTEAQAAAAVADEQTMAQLCQERMELIGLLGIADTPRPDAVGLLTALTAAGTAVRVITGDHPVTAAAIVADLGFAVADNQIVTGAQWAALSGTGQRRAAQRAVIFARMSPEQKVQIVQVLEAAGHVCAMVGDGANDAAAIRAASIGVGVAAHGSDPARGAADVVLTDGRVGALRDALQEGTQLWQRVQSAASVLLGGNAGEVAFTLIGTAVTGRAPLNARQLLLVNMFTDALPAAAVAVSPPRGRSAAIETVARDIRGIDPRELWRTVTIRGAATTFGATLAWSMAAVTGRPRRASTVGLVALVASQLGQTLLDSRSPLVIATAAGSLTTLGTLISIPGVSQLLGCTPLGPVAWSQALSAATAAIAAAALAPKLLTRFAATASKPAALATATPATVPSRAEPTTNTPPARASQTGRRIPRATAHAGHSPTDSST